MKNHIPQTKDDLVAVAVLQQCAFADIKEDVPQLLESLQDLHWDIAYPVADYLALHVNEISDEILAILSGHDEEWKFGVLAGLVAQSPKPLNEDLLVAINRIAEQPSLRELAEELPEIAREIMSKQRD